MPDEYLADVLPIAKKIAIAQGVPDYNILQNNGKIAHQASQIRLLRHLELIFGSRRFPMHTFTLSPSPLPVIIKASTSAGLQRPSKRMKCRKSLRISKASWRVPHCSPMEGDWIILGLLNFNIRRETATSKFSVY